MNVPTVMNKIREKKFTDPLLPTNWVQVRLSQLSNKMTAWCCKEQNLEYGRDWILHTQDEPVWIVCGTNDKTHEPLEFRTKQKFHYFFFKNPVNATAFGLKFYENHNL